MQRCGTVYSFDHLHITCWAPQGKVVVCETETENLNRGVSGNQEKAGWGYFIPNAGKSFQKVQSDSELHPITGLGSKPQFA